MSPLTFEFRKRMEQLHATHLIKLRHAQRMCKGDILLVQKFTTRPDVVKFVALIKPKKTKRKKTC